MIDDFLSEAVPEVVRKRYRGLAAAAKEKDFGELDADVVVLDTETTGVSFKHDELMQIAAARMQKGEIVDWYVTFVNPGKKIPDEIQHLTGITPADVVDAPTPQKALADLVEFVGDSDIVAHNADFDRTFTTNHPEGAALLENVWIDSLDLARIALPRLKSHRLIDLAHAFEMPESTHRADDDVAATCLVYRVLLAAVDAMPKELVAAIAQMATVEEWPSVKVFKVIAATAKDVRAFDLRAMRRERVKGLEAPNKADAENLAAAGKTLEFPTAGEIEEAFTEQGVVGGAYGDYEARTEQVAMSKAVADAFRASENLVVEAGTGVGKSMAYLVPAALSAKKNGIAVGVATKTNNLLDQLVNKELPLLDEVLGGLTFAPLKGFSHYPCLRLVNRLFNEGPRMVEAYGRQVHQAPALAGLLSFIEQSEYDDIDGLKIDYRTVPRYLITTNSHECLRRKCPFFGTACFVHGARHLAETSDIVVTNHSLLFCDLAAEGGLLPPIRYWIVDEAHGAEAEGRRAFSVDLAADEIMRIANRVAADEPSRNVFLRVERRLGTRTIDEAIKENEILNGQRTPKGADVRSGEGSTPLYALTNKARAAGKAYGLAAAEFTRHMKDLLYFDASKRSKGYEYVELWINDDIRSCDTFKALVAFGRALSDAAEKLITAAQELVGFLEGMEGAAELQREIAAMTLELRDILNAADIILFSPSTLYAYAANLVRSKDKATDKLSALMVNIGERLNETLYANTHSVVFTSATLTVDGGFDAFASALGLNSGEGSSARFLQLDSSYDFDENMTVYVVSDIPEPNDSNYLTTLEKLLVDIHRAQEGSTLTLFTNRREMETCFDVVKPILHEDDLRLVCQKWGVSVKGLRDDFLADEHLSLFALKSFWEGFDAPGATLKTVVIPKLPFKKPSDPLSCERAQFDSQAWTHYVLPEAILETKQAAGRLIRSSTDTGSLVLADHRLISKGYGKKFLRSLPSNTIKIMTMEEIAAELAEKR